MTAAAQQRETLQGWFAGRLPDGWFMGPPQVTVDREEILVVGEVGDVSLQPDAGSAAVAAAAAARIQRFRDETRGQRMRIAAEAEQRFGRKVAWGARCGDREVQFTSLSVPVMTRLRQRERMVLDTLVEAGVARSRSDALAWCVKLVGDNESEWISGLRDALTHVERVRNQGPSGP
ncbi:MAG: hypothetical protein KY458_06450, partial [Actinobacteria bacterium]|nr:hypothetical protein [Actinomycetota bacterium]